MLNPFESFTQQSVISLVGAGGKTSLLFYLGQSLPWNCLLTTTTKVGTDQIQQADCITSFHAFRSDPACVSDNKMTWVSPDPAKPERKVEGFSLDQFSQFAEIAVKIPMPILVEADGAHCLHLKAPAENEPVIPDETTHVLDVIGIDVVGKRLGQETVHRLPHFMKITESREGDLIDAEMIMRAILHPSGGFKNAPDQCRKIVVLNQADTPDKIEQAENLAELVLPRGIDEVWITCLSPDRDKNNRGILKTYQS